MAPQPTTSRAPALPPIPGSGLATPSLGHPPSSLLAAPSSSAGRPRAQTANGGRGARDAADGAADGGGERRRKAKNRERAYETFIFVRPPPSSKTNPMNFQCQLVLAAPGGQARRASEFSVNSVSSRRSTTATAGLGPSPSSTSLADPHAAQEMLDNVDDADDDGRRGSAGSTTQGASPSAAEGLLRPLSRSTSVRSTTSVGSTASCSPSVFGSASVLSDAASTRSTTSAASSSSGAKRVVPLYNLQFHTVRQTTVADAGTDAKIGVFQKRALELVGLGTLECCAMAGTYVPLSTAAPASSSGASTPSTAAGASSYFPQGAVSAPGSTASSPPPSHARLGIPTQAPSVASPRISLDTLFARPSLDDARSSLKFGSPSLGGARALSPSGSTSTASAGGLAGQGGQGRKVIQGAVEDTANASKKLFGRLFGNRKKDGAGAGPGSSGGSDDGSAPQADAGRQHSRSNTLTPASVAASRTSTSSRLSARDGAGGASSRPKSAYSTHSVASSTATTAVGALGGGGGGGYTAGAPQTPYLGGPTLGLAPVVRPAADGAGGPSSSKASAYVWVVAKWASPTDGWSFAALSETLSNSSHALSAALLSPGLSSSSSGPGTTHGAAHRLETATTVHFEWIRGRPRGKAGAKQGRKRAGTTVTLGSTLSGSNGRPSPPVDEAFPGGGPVGDGVEGGADDDEDGAAAGGSDDDGDNNADGGANDDDEDPEDSEVPWLCYAVRTAFGPGPVGSPPAAVERVLLGKLSPAPHHPKIVAQLRMPFPLAPLALPRALSANLGLSPEQMKDVVCTTAMFLFVREGWGGIGAKGRR